MNLENQISELLYQHDCVIVTDFGGFVTNYRPAFIHPAHHTIAPPSKKIAFNSSLIHNDGLLANHIAAKLNINYADACDMIKNFKEDCFEVLNNGGQLSLDKIGVLYLDREKNIQFNADSNANYLLDSFGFSTLHAPVLRVETDKEAIVKAFNIKEKTSWWRLLEVVPAAAAIALLLLNPGTFNRFLNTSYNSFNPIESFTSPDATAAIAKPANKITPVEVENLKTNIDAVTSTPVERENNTNAIDNTNNNVIAIAPTSRVKEVATESISNESSAGSFYIIAGCFKIEANAENFKNDLISKGYHANIVGTFKGLQVVSCSASATRSEAEAALQNIKQTLEAGAWIMEK